MSEFAIVTDSNVDIPEVLKEKFDFLCLPMPIFISGYDIDNTKPMKESMTFDVFYDLMRKNEITTTTSLVNTVSFLNEFTPLLEEGKDILCIAFSSGLSGTYSAALVAQKELQDKFPDRKIYVVDSLCASLGGGLLNYCALTMQSEGKDIDTVYKWVEDNKLKICHYFTVDDLVYLKRGGRLSAAQALIGGMLGVKPLLRVGNDGKLEPCGKAKGRKNAILDIIKYMEKSIVNPQEQTIFISHADTLSEAEMLAGLVKEKFNPKEIYIDFIPPNIGSHSGPGTIAIFYFAKGR